MQILKKFFNLNNFSIPTGTYGVGKAEYHLIDLGRKETNNQAIHRELMVHIWYPTDTKTRAPKTSYDSDAMANMREFIKRESGIPLWLLSGLDATLVYTDNNAKIAASDNSFPAIIATHGSGTMIQHYTWMCEELASQGYVIVGINHTYMATTRFPDGRMIYSLLNQKKQEGRQLLKRWKQEQFEVAVQDVKFVIDYLSKFNSQPTSQFYKRLDLAHIGMFGHSGGGSLTMRMCLEDKRIKAGVAFDSGLRGNLDLAPLHIPFLEIVAKKSRIWADAEGKIEREKLNQLCKSSQPVMTIIELDDVGHGSFTDLPLLLHQTILTQALSKYITVDLDASSTCAIKAQSIAKNVTINFFDKYLKQI